MELIPEESRKIAPSPPANPDNGRELHLCDSENSPAVSLDEDSKCRKSSRLKKKMCKQDQDKTQLADSYNFRLSSLVKRAERQHEHRGGKERKGRNKPPPLSKYRRRTANARERMRMKEINEGFERLRQCLPTLKHQDFQGNKNTKITKFTILSLALNYIHALRDLLGHSSTDCDSSSGGPFDDESNLGSDGASARAPSVSSASCDDTCSNPSPSSSSVYRRKSLIESLHNSVDVPLKDTVLESPCNCLVPSKDLEQYQNVHLDPAVGLGFKEDEENLWTSPVSDSCMFPSSPCLSLPEDCMDLDQSDLLNVSISLATLEDIVDTV